MTKIVLAKPIPGVVAIRQAGGKMRTYGQTRIRVCVRYLPDHYAVLKAQLREDLYLKDVIDAVTQAGIDALGLRRVKKPGVKE